MRDVSLEVADREFLVLVGPSGCGKSTTLRMIAGLEEVSRGDIFIDGRSVNNVPPKDRDIAMVFQNYALYPHMSVFDNLAFGLKMRGYGRSEVGKRVGLAAEILDIGALLDRRPRQLSGGQRQRVALGRAIVRQPKVFLFDEPLSNLDAKMRVQTRAELAKLHQRLQATMIYVTHDQVEAMTMGDRIAVLADGDLQQHAAPLTLYREPRNLFVAGFLGSPPMNFIVGQLTQCGDRLVFREAGNGTLEVNYSVAERPTLQPYVGRELTLGVRPEHLTPNPGAPVAGEASVKGVVDFVESLGAETSVYLQTGWHLLVCRAQNTTDFGRVGHRLTLWLDRATVHFFDPLTTARVA